MNKSDNTITPIVIPGLERGDRTAAARLHGCSVTLVYRILSGERTDTIGLEKTLRRMVDVRNELKANAKSPTFQRGNREIA